MAYKKVNEFLDRLENLLVCAIIEDPLEVISTAQGMIEGFKRENGPIVHLSAIDGKVLSIPLGDIISVFPVNSGKDADRGGSRVEFAGLVVAVRESTCQVSAAMERAEKSAYG